MKAFYSHSKKLEDGSYVGVKLIKDHIKGVLDNSKAQLFTTKNLHLFEIDFAEQEKFLEVLVTFHDFGKYPHYFQDYLLHKDDTDDELRKHSRFGGLLAYNQLVDENSKWAIAALYLIFMHHGALRDLNELRGIFDRRLPKNFQQQSDSIIPHLDSIATELNLKNLDSLVKYPDDRIIRKAFNSWVKKEATIKDYFFLNYFFSLLIEGDKLDASETSLYSPKKLPLNSVDERFGKATIPNQLPDLDQLDNNQLRNYCRASVIKNLDNSDILDQYLFTLTAPTGIGKTMTALDFSLKLKNKIRDNFGYEAPIIYALPFINIIEQAINEYKTTLPSTVRVLGHYQLADVFGKTDRDDRKDYHQKLMALDTWQGDIIITSFVQFFETLIGNRNKLLKKFNHYAGAIIILDEVQTLSLDQMPLIGGALYFLAKYLKSRIILMTATKPKIFDLAQKEILEDENEQYKSLELLPDFKRVFRTFNRTQIIPLLNLSYDSESICNDFVKRVFSKKWQPDKSCIVVCNTVKRSIEMHDEISKYLKICGYNNPVFYLSTNIIPAHRLIRIKCLNRQLKRKNAPILIATQVVEAGVDLDFDMGFRDIGPIDSIIQVAGRINRHNNPLKLGATLYIIDLEDCRKIYGILTYEQAKFALQKKEVIPEREYLEIIDNYFDRISDRSSFAASRKIFNSMKTLKYDAESASEFAVSSFKIIKESNNATSVFIELGNREIELKNKYLQKIKGEISTEIWDRKYKTQFQQRIIAVPSNLAGELVGIYKNEENLKIAPFDLIFQLYNIQTGFVREQQSLTVMF